MSIEDRRMERIERRDDEVISHTNRIFTRVDKLGKVGNDSDSGAFVKPVGEMKKIVSLVDRGIFDEIVYPKEGDKTLLQPVNEAYHNFIQTIEEFGFAGSPTWNQRLTFEIPKGVFDTSAGDFLNFITFRIKPGTWFSYDIHKKLASGRYVYQDISGAWCYASSLGTIAIEYAEMEVDGVIVERIDSTYIDLMNKINNTSNEMSMYEDSIIGARSDAQYLNEEECVRSIYPTEDGYVYINLPFWFTKHSNSAFPIISCDKPIRFHIKLRPFDEVVRKLHSPKGCKEMPVNQTITMIDTDFPYEYLVNVHTISSIPALESATIICGLSHIDGDLRKAYTEAPHDLLMNSVTVMHFAEPLKYVVGTSDSDTIKIGLPLDALNGPLNKLIFVIRRKAVTAFSDWTNYSALLPNEVDPIYNPNHSLLVHAQLMVGTCSYIDEDEAYWNQYGGIHETGGIQVSGNYIYSFSFGENPGSFSPSGSINTSRVDLGLNLTVKPPGGAADGEWEVLVYGLTYNWMKFENGLANMVFMD
jgi:hypothetical protein